MSLVAADLEPAGRPRLPRWALVVVIWTAFGVLLAGQQTIASTLRGAPVPWWTAFFQWMPVALGWALATPAILWLGRRFPLRRGAWRRSALVHAAACCVLVFVLSLGYTLHVVHLIPPAGSPPPPFDRAVQVFVGWLLWDAILYWAVLSVSYVAEQQRRLRAQELRTSRLETQLVEAELEALKMQLQPHFLFNALHTIGSLVRAGDRDNAVRVVARLGDLLRRVLDGGRQQQVALARELEFVREYLDIERIRFRDRLTAEIAVEDGVADAAVPHLILQPLVENAIRHGIAPRAAGGRVAVCARRVGGRLELVVRDDGPGTGNGATGEGRPGLGLANTRARLTRLYGADATLDVGDAADGGLEVRVTLPFQPAWAGAR
jgi:two-component sensor histidine kinase